MGSQITSLTIVYPTVYSCTDQKLRVTGLCEGNSPLTGEFPAQRASSAENVSIWWRHHDIPFVRAAMSNASFTSHSRTPYGLFTGCSRAVLNKNRTSTRGSRAAPYEFCLLVRGPYSFNVCLISLRAPYGFRYHKQPVNNPCGDGTGPVRVPYGHRRRPCGIFANSGCAIPLRVRKGAVRHSCVSRTGPARVPLDMKNIEDSRAGPVRCPCGHRTGYPWSPANYSTKP